MDFKRNFTMKKIFLTLLFFLALALAGPRNVMADSSAVSTESTKLAGDNRYETARILGKAWSDQTGTLPGEVILVTGTDFPDALSANSLAGLLNCPIILSRRDVLPDATIELLNTDWQGSVEKVTFVGGGFSEAVKASLRDCCGIRILDDTTYAGSNRYETAEKVCQSLLSSGCTQACFITTGQVPADALSAASISYIRHYPLLLVKNGVMTEASRLLAGQFENIYILGAEGAVPASVEDNFGTRVSRIGGSNRYETSAFINWYFYGAAESEAENIIFAPGPDRNFPDALAAGPCAALNNSPVVLISDEGLRASALPIVRALLQGSGTWHFYFAGAAAQNDLPLKVTDQFHQLLSESEREPESGTYILRNQADPSKALTVASSSADERTSLRLEKASNGDHRFTLTKIDGGYLISPLCSALALDVQGGKTEENTPVQQYHYNNTPAQKWLLLPNEDGSYRLATSLNGSCYLTPSDAWSQSSPAVIHTPLSGSDALTQNFYLEKNDMNRVLPDGVFTLNVRDTDYALSLKGEATTQRTSLILDNKADVRAQQFRFIYSSDGTYTIKNVNSALVLDRTGGSGADGTVIQQYKENGTEAQKWKPVYDENKGWYFKAAGGSLGLSGSVKKGTTLQLRNQTSGQLAFSLIPVRIKVLTDIRYLEAGALPEKDFFQSGNLNGCFQSYVITVGDDVYNRIIGKSYPAGCPLPLSSLRYLKVLHYNFEGRVQVGEMITAARLADDVTAVFRELYNNQYQIRQMYLVDNYWTGNAQTTDVASVTADNTASFNYRAGTGQTTGLSNHAYGYAIDINPRENPYIQYDGSGRMIYFEPDNAAPYLDRSTGNSHYITSGDLACRLFKARGFGWGGDWSNPKDYQHFEKVS